jgi:hypothetical protein
MRHNDLHLHATAAGLAVMANVTGVASPLVMVASFYFGVIIRRFC